MRRDRIILALVLAALFVFAAACKPLDPVVTETDAIEAAAATAAPTKEPTPEPTAEPTSEPTSEPIPEPKEFQRGVWTDTVYENAYLNLRFTMPEGFVAATDEEILTMMELGEDVVENDKTNEFQKKIAAMKTVYDMMVTNPATGSNVIVLLENLKLTIGGSSFTPEAYAEVLKTQIDGTVVSGYTYAVYEGYTAEMGGESYYVLPTVLGDGLMYQDFYLRRVDGYMLAIGISYAGGYDAEGTLIRDAFAALDA